jgi:hypothetical protein
MARGAALRFDYFDLLQDAYRQWLIAGVLPETAPW